MTSVCTKWDTLGGESKEATRGRHMMIRKTIILEEVEKDLKLEVENRQAREQLRDQRVAYCGTLTLWEKMVAVYPELDRGFE